MILQAEQFKAQIAAPKGNDFDYSLNLTPEIEMLRCNDNDDDFFPYYVSYRSHFEGENRTG